MFWAQRQAYLHLGKHFLVKLVCRFAAIPVHQQEGSPFVSSEEEASKDCMDNCLQKAAQEGQLHPGWHHRSSCYVTAGFAISNAMMLLWQCSFKSRTEGTDKGLLYPGFGHSCGQKEEKVSKQEQCATYW